MNLALAAAAAAIATAACSAVTVVQQPFTGMDIHGHRPPAPPPPPPRVVLTESSIQITEKIQFAFDKADILPGSHALMNEIVQVLKDNPQIEVVQIEGHTDATGTAKHNRDLSQRRAESVRTWIGNAGIDSKRLVAKGFGSDKPIGDNATDDGKEKNRRVEFNIVKQGPKKTVVQDQ